MLAPLIGGTQSEVKTIGRYRSIPQTFNRILERALYIQISKILEWSKLIFDEQFCFRAHQDTLDALSEITEKSSVFQISIIVASFFTKTFDIKKHGKFLRKVEVYGLLDVPNNWKNHIYVVEKYRLHLGERHLGLVASRLVFRRAR